MVKPGCTVGTYELKQADTKTATGYGCTYTLFLEESISQTKNLPSCLLGTEVIMGGISQG